MSIYATKYIIDEDTGESVLVKHLNKIRVDRITLRPRVGGWNKSGRASRVNKRFKKGNPKIIVHKFQELDAE